MRDVFFFFFLHFRKCILKNPLETLEMNPGLICYICVVLFEQTHQLEARPS